MTSRAALLTSKLIVRKEAKIGSAEASSAVITATIGMAISNPRATGARADSRDLTLPIGADTKAIPATALKAAPAPRAKTSASPMSINEPLTAVEPARVSSATATNAIVVVAANPATPTRIAWSASRPTTAAPATTFHVGRDRSFRPAQRGSERPTGLHAVPSQRHLRSSDSCPMYVDVPSDIESLNRSSRANGYGRFVSRGTRSRRQVDAAIGNDISGPLVPP